jgi:uncharacterized protein
VLAGIGAPSTEVVAVSWYGAEPMVGWPVLQELSERFVRAADGAGVDYVGKIVTNGSLLTLDKIMKLRHECRVTQFDITLDGPARIHDTHRPLKNGSKSFDHIVNTLHQALSSGDLDDVCLVLRTNIDVNNIEWVEEYLAEMAGRGFADERVVFNLAPVYSWGNDVSDVELDRREYALNEVRWMHRMTELGLRFEALPNEPIGALCAAVTRATEIHSSTGNMFSCSEYPLVPAHEAAGGIGRTEDIPLESLRPVGPFDDWHDAVEAGETPCQKCVFLAVCGGGCPKQWREGNVPCPPFKFSVQERFDLIASLHDLAVAGPATP